MPIPLVFQGKFTEKYFKKFHLPKIQFQLLDGRSMDILPLWLSCILFSFRAIEYVSICVPIFFLKTIIFSHLEIYNLFTHCPKTACKENLESLLIPNQCNWEAGDRTLWVFLSFLQSTPKKTFWFQQLTLLYIIILLCQKIRRHTDITAKNLPKKLCSFCTPISETSFPASFHEQETRLT